MPFLRFHFVDAERLASVSPLLTDRLQEMIGCPREHIVLEIFRSVVVGDEGVQAGEWPFVEVDYFQRPRDVQDEVAKIVSESLQIAGYPNSDVHFRYLNPENYYENGKCRH